MKNMLNSLWYQVHGVHSLNLKVDFSMLNETLDSFDTLKHNEQDHIFFYIVHLRSCIIFSSIILGFSFFRFKKHDLLIFLSYGNSCFSLVILLLSSGFSLVILCLVWNVITMHSLCEPSTILYISQMLDFGSISIYFLIKSDILRLSFHSKK